MENKNTVLSKKDILDAAEKTLRRYGPKKTSVTDVAKELNISHGTIYRHFPTKTALKEAVTERWLEEEIITPLKQLINADKTDPDQLMKTFILKLISLKQNHAANDVEMFEMYAEVTATSIELVDNHVNGIIEMLSFIIEQGIQTNIIRKVNHRDLARSIFYATTKFHHPFHANEWKRGSMSKEFDKVWELIRGGFKVSKE
ncbi:TetR/AcrR family transcriptional regulator [Bacillus sp. 03113]|uniref:TetR/AcrR family transcriptional regulator n=1 Tax=Bacillus sp. 03113 TaxID=2578211 RepID=UPI0011443383|nr:TetR/AcrR family transcriptional regulator [Bacillus sp. 03113]